MAITKEEAAARGVAVDNPLLLERLKDGLAELIGEAFLRGFTRPYDVTVRDSDGSTLREFTIDANGRPVIGKCDDEHGFFTAPFTLYLVDTHSAVAKLCVNADLTIGAVEIQHAGSQKN